MNDKKILSDKNLSSGLTFNDDTNLVEVKLNSDDKILNLDNNGISSNLDLSFDNSTNQLTLKGKNSQNIAQVDLDSLHYESGEGINIDESNNISVDTAIISTIENVNTQIKNLSDGQIKINKDAIDKLNGDKNTTGSVAYLINKLESGTVKSNSDAIIKLNGNDLVSGSVAQVAKTTLSSAKSYTDDKINGLDVTDNPIDKQFINSVSQVNGNIIVSRKALVSNDIPTLDISKILNLQTILDDKCPKFETTDNADLSTDDGIVNAIKLILNKMGMKDTNITLS
jgi:hypothetical protein